MATKKLTRNQADKQIKEIEKSLNEIADTYWFNGRPNYFVRVMNGQMIHRVEFVSSNNITANITMAALQCLMKYVKGISKKYDVFATLETCELFDARNNEWYKSPSFVINVPFIDNEI